MTNLNNLPTNHIDVKRFIPNLSAPNNNTAVYGSIYIGTNTPFDDWKSVVLDWTQQNGHGIYHKFLQVQHTVTVGWLHFTHRMSNTKWYQDFLSAQAGFPIAIRWRKIAGAPSKEYSALHIDVAKTDFQRCKEFLRKYFSKQSKQPYITGFPLYYIPDKSHIINNHSRSGAAIITARQHKVLKNLVVRTNWLVSGIDRVDTTTGISLRTMISRIQWKDKSGNERQLFHSVDDTYNKNGVIFTWHPEFDDQASMVMTGLLAYLRAEYGDSVEQYFTSDCIDMQSGQKWDASKGGIVNEDDDHIIDVQNNTTWWDIDDKTGGNKIVMDVTNVVTTTKPVEGDDSSLPTVNTNPMNPSEPQLPPLTQMLLNSPPPAATQTNETATVSSGLTLDTVATRMDAVEGSVASVQSNMAEVQNTLNHTNLMMRQLCSHLKLNKDAARSNETSGEQS